MQEPREILPDVITHGLRVLFCGMAVSQTSHRAKAYYAGPGNRFWLTLFEIGLTPRLLRPSDCSEVLRYRIGLTDIVKHSSGADREVAADAAAIDAFRGKVERFRPAIVAFNGKGAAKLALSLQSVEYGPTTGKVLFATTWVLPSTSGSARRYWDPKPWMELAAAAR